MGRGHDVPPSLALVLSESRSPQSFRKRQLGLPLIEGPELPNSQLQRTSHVKRGQRPGTQPGHVPRRKLHRHFECHVRDGDFHPHSCLTVVLEVAINAIRFRSRDLFVKDVLCDWVCPFGPMQRRQSNLRTLLHPTLGLRRVPDGTQYASEAPPPLW